MSKYLSLVGLLIVVGALSGCGDNPYNAEILSEVTLAHTHHIRIPCPDFEVIPAGGKTYTTWNQMGGGAHTHTVTLSEQDFEDAHADPITIVTNADGTGHSHEFIFRSCF